jgi:hypothetical protein
MSLLAVMVVTGAVLAWLPMVRLRPLLVLRRIHSMHLHDHEGGSGG